MIIWMTGLVASGKTTHAKRLVSQFPSFFHIDADMIRGTISYGLKYSVEDRLENQRRMRALVFFLLQTGIENIIISSITPFQEVRNKIKTIFDNAHIVYCKASIEVCKSRDKKGIYKKREVTGIDSPFEQPENPDFILYTDRNFKEQSDRLIGYVRNYIKPIKYMTLIGRWNPLHEGHKELIRKTYIKNDCPVLIMVRITHEEHLTPGERAKKIEQWMREENIKGRVILVPDIEGVYYGRKVGYKIEQVNLSEDLEKISGTEIRRNYV